MRILIVEDEKRVSQFLRKGFQEESYSVEIVADGESASDLARTGEYDAIILDIMLPKKSGIEVLKDIRRSKVTTPVLILSSKGDLEDRVEGLNLGADDYLPKPFAFSEVLARVRSLVRRQSPGDDRSSLLTLADLTMDLLSRKVTRANREIILTNKEFQLLEHLLRNKRRVMSRVLLTEHVWEMDFDSETNIVDVVVNRLRRKIDDGFTVPLIHTVRGVGYVLREPTNDPAP
ncbi:MAG: response regulator transcription factor [Ignavibacteria bacterium]|nr:response regulator transcription factor [Ignavibacteria bacterium]